MTDKNNEQHIIWVDMEMTGLDIENDHIIEIAVLITDGNLNVLDEVCYWKILNIEFEANLLKLGC